MTVYNFKVITGRRITVRENPRVEPGDYVGELTTGQTFSGELVVNTDAEKWVKLTNVHPGSYVAVVYKGQSFADVVGGTLPAPGDDTPPDNEQPVKTVLFPLFIDPENKRIAIHSPQGIDLKEWEISVDNVVYMEAQAG